MNSKVVVLALALILLAAGAFIFSSRKNPETGKVDTTQITSASPQSNTQESPSPANESVFTIIADNLEVPWALAFLPDKSLILTERPGRVRLIDKNGKLQKDPIFIVPDVKAQGEGGLLGVTVDPAYSTNHQVYLYFTYDSQKTLNRVVRYIFDGKIFKQDKIIVDAIPGAVNHNGGRLKFGPDGFLYITAGDSLEPSLSQNKDSLAGKVLRVDKEGQAAAGNPFSSPIYSLGHRNPQGLAWDEKDNLWETEHGNNATDELNLIKPGQNYGWPTIKGDEKQNGLVSPVAHSGNNNTWAPSGMAYLNGSLFFGALRGSALLEAKLKGESATISEHFKNQFGRIRDVVLGPDGFLYITTSNRDGRGPLHDNDDKIIKVNPTKL